MAVTAVVFDVGETLVDETRNWEHVADACGVPRFTLMALVGAAAARGESPRIVRQWLDIDPPRTALRARRALPRRGAVPAAVEGARLLRRRRRQHGHRARGSDPAARGLRLLVRALERREAGARVLRARPGRRGPSTRRRSRTSATSSRTTSSRRSLRGWSPFISAAARGGIWASRPTRRSGSARSTSCPRSFRDRLPRRHRFRRARVRGRGAARARRGAHRPSARDGRAQRRRRARACPDRCGTRRGRHGGHRRALLRRTTPRSRAPTRSSCCARRGGGCPTPAGSSRTPTSC